MFNLRMLIILGIVILLLSGFIVIQIRTIGRLKTEREQLVKLELSNDKTINWYKNKLGNEVARVKVLSLDVKNMKSLRESDRLQYLKQFKGVKKNLKNVSTAISAEGESKQSFTFVLSDTVGGKTFKAPKDPFVSLSGSILGDTIKLSIDRIIRLKGAIFWQRKRFLGLRIGRKEYTFDLVSEDPSVRITGLEAIQVKRK